MSRNGTLEITIYDAKGVKDTQTAGKQDPYCLIVPLDKQLQVIEEDQLLTDVASNGGTNPVWNKTYHIPFSDRNLEWIRVDIWNKNDRFEDQFIGRTRVPLTRTLNEKTDSMTLPVIRPSGKHKGTLSLSLKFIQLSKSIDGLDLADFSMGAPRNGYNGAQFGSSMAVGTPAKVSDAKWKLDEQHEKYSQAPSAPPADVMGVATTAQSHLMHQYQPQQNTEQPTSHPYQQPHASTPYQQQPASIPHQQPINTATPPPASQSAEDRASRPPSNEYHGSTEGYRGHHHPYGYHRPYANRPFYGYGYGRYLYGYGGFHHHGYGGRRYGYGFSRYGYGGHRFGFGGFGHRYH